MELAQSYPVREDLAVMEAALDIFLRTKHGAARKVMHSVLHMMLERYRTDRIALSRC